jgi:predicted Ser/Thr protein kinase
MNDEQFNEKFTTSIIHSVQKLKDLGFKERLAGLCEMYERLIALIEDNEIPMPAKNILVNQDINTIRDLEHICNKLNNCTNAIMEMKNMVENVSQRIVEIQKEASDSLSEENNINYSVH